MPKQALPANHSHQDISDHCVHMYEHLKSELISVQKPRPAWDTELLEGIGFQNITVDLTPSERLYKEQDEFYNPTPIFTICAVR